MYRAPVRVPDFVTLAKEQQRQEAKGHNSFFAYNPEKESIKVKHTQLLFSRNVDLHTHKKAYLRIRPQSDHYEFAPVNPYLNIVDDLEISMTPPEVTKYM